MKHDPATDLAGKENVPPSDDRSEPIDSIEDAGKDLDESTSGRNKDGNGGSKKDATKTDRRKKQSKPRARKSNDTESGESKTTQLKREHNNDPAEDADNHHDNARKRTRRDLEFDWDRSQLRDPRPTPERVVPPCKGENDLTEEEKALFKGSPPKRPQKKGRLNAFDKDAMFKEEARKNIAHVFHELHICFDKGPNGSPTYDKSGFRLDYKKVADWMKPKAYNKGSMMSGMNKAVARAEDEKKRMAAAFFEGGKGPEGIDESHYAVDLIKDKVSKDLGIAWHKVGSAQVEEWAEKGFPKQMAKDYVRDTVTNEERKRLSSLETGASLRK